MSGVGTCMEIEQQPIDVAMWGYAIAKEFEGHLVRVYLFTGSVLSGELIKVTGKFVYVQEKNKNLCAIANMDHVTSITRQD